MQRAGAGHDDLVLWASDRGMAHFIGMHFLLQIAIRLIHEMGRIEVYEQEYRKLLALMASTEPTIPADWPRIVSEGRPVDERWAYPEGERWRRTDQPLLAI